jgi:FkbM family methyltransferase
LARVSLVNELLQECNQNIENLNGNAKSQIEQDLFVAATLRAKKSGFFVEFGATDGISLSNTYLLEKSFGWSGILVEPARHWHKSLAISRASKIDFRCVSNLSNTMIKFVESDSAELSTIKGFEKIDDNKRFPHREYEVETISLLDLLRFHDSPSVIDYLSIDTEGSEFQILENFDFSEYKFRIITCEHNFTENREKIFKLLSKNGYKRVWPEFTQFDDWYINPELI